MSRPIKATREPRAADTIIESAAAGSHTRQYSIEGVASLSASASVSSQLTSESDVNASAVPMLNILKYLFMELYLNKVD